jgi:hypothetical protein
MTKLTKAWIEGGCKPTENFKKIFYSKDKWHYQKTTYDEEVAWYTANIQRGYTPEEKYAWKKTPPQ